MLVQPRIDGRDFRVVVLDDEVVSAYERLPLTVVGDGRSTVSELLARKQEGFVDSGRDTVIETDDPRITRTLERKNMTLQAVVSAGVALPLLANANLSAGGDSIDCTDAIHPEFAEIAIEATKAMSLRICGVDIISKQSIAQEPDDYSIIELNSIPGFDNYAAAGAEQLDRVRAIYTKIVQALVAGSRVPIA
jgi:D-alanine-D-alanine ligase-like ATP-grasp enzyme